MNSSTVGIIGLILFLTAVIIAYIRLRHWQEGFEEQLEGFVDPTVAAIPPPANISPIQKNSTFCPSGSTYFVSNNGDSMCCNGPIRNRICRGNIVCTMSRLSGEIPSCTDVHNAIMAKLAVGFCPQSMPNYYSNEATGQKGCTSSAITTSGDGPLHTDAPKCSIGNAGPEADLQNEQSCLNIKRKDDMKCLTPNCIKIFQKKNANAPLILVQNYTLVDETTARVCTDEDSMEIYLNKTEPNWRSANKPEYDFTTNTDFCGAAKRILVEKRAT
jgi:hypothetical protein